MSAYLDSLLNVVIDTQTLALRQRGFGLPLLLAYHSFWTDRVRIFGSLEELSDAGVPGDHPIFLMAQSIKAQDPAPPFFMVGRRTSAFTQEAELTPMEPIEVGKVFAFDIDGQTVSYTAEEGDDADDVVGALVTAANALSLDITAAPDDTPANLLEIEADNEGELFAFNNLRNLAFEDVTEDPGITDDWDAVIAQDSSFYGVMIDSNSKDQIVALAPRIETARKLFIAQTADTEVGDPAVEDDVMSAVQTGGFSRTSVWYHHRPMQYFAGGLMGMQLPKAPGSTNWAWQFQIATVDFSRLTDGQRLAIDNKNGNHYTDLAGQDFGITMDATTGTGEFIDVVRFRDWMHARTQERLLSLFLNSEKVPQTQGGLDLIENELRGQFSDGIVAGGLDPDFEAVIDFPSISDIPQADLANRKATLLRGTHRLAGAWNSADLTITLVI